MKRSERMAKLKAERDLKMKQRRARMAAKKSGSTKRAFDDEAVKIKASKVYSEALKKGGGAFAAKKRREFLKDAQFKMDTRNTKKPTKTTGTTGSTGTKITTPPPNPKKSFVSTVTPKEKPKAPPKSTGTTESTEFDEYKKRQDARLAAQREKAFKGMREENEEFDEYKKRQDARLAAQREKAFEGMREQNKRISSFFNRIFPGKSNKPPTDAAVEEANRLVEEGYRKNKSVNRIANEVKKTLGDYIDTDEISNFVEGLFKIEPRRIKRNPPNQGPYAPGLQTEVRPLGRNKMKKGGKVKKGYKKGCSVKKGYKSGGKVRGSGCVTKGVRPCKMR